MSLVLLALMFSLVTAGCFTVVLIHAFRRSVGTGVMVLLLPFYSCYYGFSQFEHPRKFPVLAGWLGGLVMAVMLTTASVRLTQV